MPRLAATLAPVALVAASLGATLPGCGGGDASPDAAATADAIVRPDAIAGCVTWARVERAADTIASIDPAPVNTDRTTRVALVAEVAACDQPAMPIVRYDPDTRRAFAPMAVLEPAITCPPSTQTLTRPVELRLPSPGTWTIYAGADASAPSVTIDVASPPDRACATGGACELDCDCA
ncbi:MAG: hypothetical protein KC464_31600, partial [Myxococcales bacterium]|nr:hypothetical protein [Myxococcales bacterium]